MNSTDAIEIDFSDKVKGKNGKQASRQTIKNRLNRELSTVIPTYNDGIPFDAISAIVTRFGGQVVDEAGEPWQGILCGEDSHTTMTIAGLNLNLYLSWYRMPSGRYEITVYVS
jgi:hypothetical protein